MRARVRSRGRELPARAVSGELVTDGANNSPVANPSNALVELNVPSAAQRDPPQAAAAVSRSTCSSRQPQLPGLDVLLEVRERAGARDRQRHGRVGEQPGERDLAGARVVLGGDLGGRSAGLGEVAGGQREPGEEAEPVALADGEHAGRAAVGEVEAVLDADDVDDRARDVELLDADVGDADVADLALVLELLQGADGLLVGHLGIGRVQLVEVDPIDAQVAQRALAGIAQVLRARVARPLPRARALQPALRRDQQPLRVGVQRLGDELLADVRPVAVGRVDEVHAELDRAPDDRQRRVAIGRRAPGAGADDPHRPEAEPPDLDVAAERERLRHCSPATARRAPRSS